jgi:hypothetical protein
MRMSPSCQLRKSAAWKKRPIQCAPPPMHVDYLPRSTAPWQMRAALSQQLHSGLSLSSSKRALRLSVFQAEFQYILLVALPEV